VAGHYEMDSETACCIKAREFQLSDHQTCQGLCHMHSVILKSLSPEYKPVASGFAQTNYVSSSGLHES
jgi:hypothetical protein